MRRVHSIADAALGNTSYLVEVGGGLAVSVDPRRDVEEHVGLAERLGVRIGAALETHLHADFVSGARELASASGAQVVAATGATLGFPHRGVSDGERFEAGDVALDVLATPGHTPEHVTYLARDGDPGAAVFSGGSLIAGGAARTDLTGAERTEELARAQFRSLRALAALPDDAALYPTHGAGSFCSTGAGGRTATTIGDERLENPLLAIEDEDAFVAALVGGFGSFPPYFLELAPVNRRGPALVSELPAPRPLAPEQARREMDGGATLIDGRPVSTWAAEHPLGAISIEVRDAFATWLGWIVPFGAPYLLLIDEEHRAEALRLARRIGYDSCAGWIEGGLAAWRDAGLPTGSVREVGAEEALERQKSGATVLDVRQRSEWAGLRIPDAINVELGQIAAGRSPEATEVITYCGHGERAATGASLLERRGIRVANLAGGLGAWRRAGLPLDRERR